MINEVDLLTINIHLMQNLIHIGLFHVPSHMILAYEHIIQRCSSLRVSSLEQIFLIFEDGSRSIKTRISSHLTTASSHHIGTYIRHNSFIDDRVSNTPQQSNMQLS